MFAEYYRKEAWQTVMPGISVCTLTDSDQSGKLPLELDFAHAEAFFCTGGSMTIQKTGGSQILVEPKEILLVSDCSHVESAVVTAPLQGVILSIDQLMAGDSFRALCHDLGNLNLSMKMVGERMKAAAGVRSVTVSPWSRAVFYALKRLPQAEQGHYCILKTFELLYLICSQEQEGTVCEQEAGGSTMTVATGMKNYMEEHMDEKLTITELSHRFHLSRTACKSAFRSCFGQPIHSWLLDRRMEKAAELLEKTKMPILQVAQAVGYTGVSQFNVAFRQRYGKSPREYRKMSVSVGF